MEKLHVDGADIRRMAEETLLTFGPTTAAKNSRFWILLTLAGIIASAGVAADSTAMVIGAMIVAPLMTPIMGTAFSLVLGDRNHLIRSLLAVFGGGLLVISIAFLFGMADPINFPIDENSQISSRIHPRLLDLIAALATGMVGAVALVRSDISDTLPGVAIAISLVPPLAVAGLTLQDAKIDEALGALLLFGTNVASIIFTATMVLLLYKVRETASDAGIRIGSLRGRSLATVLGTVILVAIPLAFGSQQIIRESRLSFIIAPMAEQWAHANGWRVLNLKIRESEVQLTVIGPPPKIEVKILREVLDDSGYADFDLVVNLVTGGTRKFPGK